MFKIHVQSPTRVDLAGGTLDCWPLYLFLENPVTVNVAIDTLTSVELTENSNAEVQLVSKDLGVERVYPNLQACLADPLEEFSLLRAHLRHWRPRQGFRLATASMSPVGGGLGGSSSLNIGLIKAFAAWLEQSVDASQMVRLASDIEAQILKKPTGTQDYFPAIFGGLNFISYGVGGPKVEVRSWPDDLFKERFLLVYTGRPHHSGINNWQVIRSWLDGDARTQRALEKLSGVSRDMKNSLETKSYDSLPNLFRREFSARVELSDGFTSPEIQRVAELANAVGAVTKICGAGGGGCVLVWCHDRQIERARRIIAEEGFTILPTQPWSAPDPGTHRT